MKNIIITILIIIATISCKAQSPIYPLSDHTIEITNGAYYKDMDGDLDNFIGTWLYQNGNTSFKITLQKTLQYFNDQWYEDLLYGEYQYIEGGVEFVNTLSNNPLDLYDFNISGCSIIYKGQYPSCSTCTLLERRVFLDFTDPDPNLSYISSAIVLRYINDGSGIDKMEVQLVTNGTKVLPYDGAPNQPTVPYGEYLLIKQ